MSKIQVNPKIFQPILVTVMFSPHLTHEETREIPNPEVRLQYSKDFSRDSLQNTSGAMLMAR